MRSLEVGALRRWGVVLAIVLIAIVVASVGLIAARRYLWYVPTTTTTTTTLHLTYIQPPKLSSSLSSFLEKECGKAYGLLVLIYLRTPPSKEYQNAMKSIFDQIVHKWTKYSGNLTLCTISLSSLEKLGLKIDAFVFPTIAVTIDKEISKQFARAFNTVDGLLVAKPELTSLIYLRLMNYMPLSSIPVETDRMPELNSDIPMIGSPSARYVLFIYEDDHCPFCAKFYNDTLPMLLKLVKEGKLAIVFKNLIVHAISREQHYYLEAMYLATHNATAYFEAMKIIYLKYILKDREVTLDQVLSLIKNLTGLTRTQLDKYLNKAREVVEMDSREAAQYGIMGTPGFVLWDRERGYGIIFIGYRNPEQMESLLHKVGA